MTSDRLKGFRPYRQVAGADDKETDADNKVTGATGGGDDRGTSVTGGGDDRGTSVTGGGSDCQLLSLPHLSPCHCHAFDSYALVVSGSPRGVDTELITCLASKANFILAVDSGADALVAAGLKPDLLLGDFDSISQETLQLFQSQGVELEVYNSYKDATDIDLALTRLHELGHNTIVATNVLGGRIDHTLASLGCFARAAQQKATVAIVEANETCLFLSAGTHNDLLCDLCDKGTECDKGTVRFCHIAQQPHDEQKCHTECDKNVPSPCHTPTYISLIPWGGEAIVSISGVEWELNRKKLTPQDTLGVSNIPKANQIHIEVHEGTVLFILSAQ